MRVNGAVLRSRYLYLKKQGPEAFARVIAALPGDMAPLVEQGFRETRWYPFEIFIAITETTDRVLGTGDGTLCYEMGRSSCDQNLTTAHRLLFKFGNIGWLLDRASKAWGAQFDEGHMRVVKRDLNVEVIVQLEGMETAHRAHCLAIKGWMVRAAEISGEDNFVCHEKCRAVGDDVCQWRFEFLR